MLFVFFLSPTGILPSSPKFTNSNSYAKNKQELLYFREKTLLEDGCSLRKGIVRSAQSLIKHNIFGVYFRSNNISFLENIVAMLFFLHPNFFLHRATKSLKTGSFTARKVAFKKFLPLKYTVCLKEIIQNKYHVRR